MEMSSTNINRIAQDIGACQSWRVGESAVSGHTGAMGDSEGYPILQGGQAPVLSPGAAEAGPKLSSEPRGGWDGDCQGGGAPSLVRQSITQQASDLAHRDKVCADGVWLQGRCEHGTERWLRLPCKRRGCPVCGEHRRRMIAWRIAKGIDQLGGEAGGGWFVGTFARDVDKSTAVKTEGKFLRWLRKELGYQVQYAATWEETKAGRLHLNLVLAPWRYVPQATLSRAWERFGGGRRVWIQRVGGGVGVEAAKAREGLGGYLGKWEQMVMTGRGVAYSKGWPKLPATPFEGRKGKIKWEYLPGRVKRVGAAGVAQGFADIVNFEYERDLGWWREVSPGEWGFSLGEECDCFGRVGITIVMADINAAALSWGGGVGRSLPSVRSVA